MLALAGCHHNHLEVTATPDNSLHGVTTADKVWIVAESGRSPADTTVAFAPAEGRTIVLRNPGDKAIYLILEIPPDTSGHATGDSGRVTIQPTAGQYSATFTASGTMPAGTMATFAYPLHFKTPPEAAAKYPSPERLAAMLSPAEMIAGGKVQVVTADRPAADMIRFPVAHAGTYALVFPR
ncbi:MAG: hypothetical protein ACREL5_02600 [Gemmatimonadales bacterium]